MEKPSTTPTILEGNQTEAKENGTVTAQYIFDATNKLTQAEVNGKETEYTYDGQGNRINVKATETDTNPANPTVIEETDCLIDPMTIYNEIIAAIDNQEEKTSLHTYGKGRVSVETEGEISYYITNEQGSVTDILDANGNIQATLKYDEFGILENPEAVSTNGNIFAYTGHVYDERTGLYYAKARYYGAEAGRFTQEDAYHGDGLNLYIYVRNNPVRFVDPSGYYALHTADGGGRSTNLSGEDVYLLYIGTDFIGRGMDPNILIMQDFLTELLYMKEQQNIDVGKLSIEELDAIYLRVSKGQTLKGAATGGGLVAAFQAPALKALTAKLGNRIIDKLGEILNASDKNPPPDQPKPPGWGDNWEWRYPEGDSNAGPRWFDPSGGEWRWHAPDKSHPIGHWDHNPWDLWNSPWRNIYP